MAEEDPNIWLEEIEGEAALDWVRGQNERSLDQLTADPRFATFEAAALEILTSNDRIPYGRVRGGHVYNFWQDEANVRGLWRRTTLESYGTDQPEWETILDVDALAADEDANWVFEGADCLQMPDGSTATCMVSLSEGGKDAVIKREFDLATKTFVPDGFQTPEAKQSSAWIDPDTLLISTDWSGDGDTLTTSGYPSIVKRWTRGTPLEAAETVFEGDRSDVASWPVGLELEDGGVLEMVQESDTFFTRTYWWIPEVGAAPVKLPLPPRASIDGVYQRQMLVTLQQDWSPNADGEASSASFQSGDLISFELETFLSTRSLGDITLAFRPDETQAVNGVAVSKSAALLSINENVAAKILRLQWDAGRWTTEAIDLPGAGQAGIVFADHRQDEVFLAYEDFLTPDSLFAYDVETGSLDLLKQAPTAFDASGLVVEQAFATSADGTQVPYFTIRKEGQTTDGPAPTLLYGYGGFEISLRPSYSGTLGRLWLEQGGVYVLANIRGGGEFGPAWHQSGLKTERQRIYDDFIAVGEAIVASGLTTPEKLGIMGGSNGGLLMGVVMNQRPDLWNAVVIQVPLLDMLRYHLLLAGASWVDEYGSPDVPEERAFLEQISPYQNFDPALPYPSPLFVTSTKDDRVHPGHARKMARKFEQAGLPFFYYENIDGGHSAAANETERAKRSALEFTYLASRLMGEAEPAEDTAQ